MQRISPQVPKTIMLSGTTSPPSVALLRLHRRKRPCADPEHCERQLPCSSRRKPASPVTEQNWLNRLGLSERGIFEKCKANLTTARKSLAARRPLAQNLRKSPVRFRWPSARCEPPNSSCEPVLSSPRVRTGIPLASLRGAPQRCNPWRDVADLFCPCVGREA